MELDDELTEYGLHASRLREGLCLTLAFSVIGCARSFGIFSSFSACENTREWLQECARSVIKLNRWVSCVNLQGVSESLISMSAICLEVLTFCSGFQGPIVFGQTTDPSSRDEFGRYFSWTGSDLRKQTKTLAGSRCARLQEYHQYCQEYHQFCLLTLVHHQFFRRPGFHVAHGISSVPEQKPYHHALLRVGIVRAK